MTGSVTRAGARAAIVVAATGVLGALAASCSLLVHFDDQPSCDGGLCADARVDHAVDDAAPDVVDGGRPDGHVGDAGAEAGDAGSCIGALDGAPCGTDDPCNDTPTCASGACTAHPKADGTPCAAAPDPCHTVPVCTKGKCGASKAQPVGYNWQPGNDNARCCGAAGAVMTTTTSNCGVCGLKCSNGETCGTVANHYLCLGCGGINANCWSNCCSTTTTDHCAPGDCAGNCASPDKCAQFGAHCQVDVVDYCTY